MPKQPQARRTRPARGEQYGGSKLARDLLPVFDNLKRALDTATEDQKAVAGALIESVN